MIPCLSQVCSLNSPFERDIADYAAGACWAVELWLGKLESYLESHTAADVAALLKSHEIAAPVASYQGGLLTSQGEQRREHWGHFRRRLDLCRELGVNTLVVAADVAGPMTQQDLDRLQVSLAEMARAAESAGVRVALEFQARGPFLNNLQTAAAVIADVGSPHLGLCLDLFHYYVGPSKTEDLGYLTRENLFHVQLCDLAGHARELATDADRVLPGDGDIPIAPVVRRLRDIGYEGPVSVELMNPGIWQVPALQFGEVAITALRKTLGLARMS
jgi:4-hydroxyphenylpyruvate dioxygenase